MPETYVDQIKVNLDAVRTKLWALCQAGHSDLAVNASREALAAANVMREMGKGEGKHFPFDPIRNPVARPTERPRRGRRRP